jgi:Transposase DDE domain
LESLLRLIDLDWTVPNFSTLSRRQKSLKVNIPYRGSAGPLHLLIDIEPLSAIGPRTMARGIKVEGEGEWTEEGQQTVRGTVCPTMAQAWRHETEGLAQDPHRN